MSTTLTVNGVGYPFPAVGDRPWAQKIINWATAVTAGMLQKSGGTFTLTAEIDFGATYGLKSAYFKSRTANPAAASPVRLANNEGIAWRNAANGADLVLKVNASDLLEYAGVAIPTAAQVAAKLSDPMTTDGDMIIRSSGSAVRLPRGSDGQVLVLSGGLPSWSSVAGTGDVVGPGSATDNSLPRFDGATGKLLQGSGIVIDDSDGITLPDEVIGNRQTKQIAMGSQAAVAGTTYCGLLGFGISGRTGVSGVGRAGSIVGINWASTLWYISGSGNSIDQVVTIRKNGSDFLTFATKTLTTAGYYEEHTEYARGAQVFVVGDVFDAKVVLQNASGAGAISHTVAVDMEVQFDS